jgi:hypothetical protein
MVDPKRIGAPSAVHVASATYTREDINLQATFTLDMTPEARAAAVEVSRNRFAIPAKEATKQSVELTNRAKETTRQVYARRVVELIVLLYGIYEIAQDTGGGKTIGVMVAAVLGTMEGVAAISRYYDQKPRLPPPKDGPT